MGFEFSYSGPPEYSVKVPGTGLTIHVSAAGGGTVEAGSRVVGMVLGQQPREGRP
jgi:hypothetical protein